jgi:hypothetical protein
VSLEGVADFKRFRVEVSSLETWEEANAALTAKALGRIQDKEHAFISVEALKRLVGEAATPAWIDELEKMLAYAKHKGWWDEATQSVAAHVVWA